MPRTITLRNDEHAVFGYGSLLSRQSMERTLGRAYEGQPTVCAVDGWRRSWDVYVPNSGKYVDESGSTPLNIIYLNVRRAPGHVNGLLYVVSAAELAAFDRREWVYDRLAISGMLGDLAVDGGEAWMYVAKPDFIAQAPRRPVFALRQTYLDIVEKGLTELGSEFRSGYEASTDLAPQDLVIQDRAVV